MEIRRLAKSDLEKFYAFRLHSLKVDPDAFMITFEEEKASGPAWFESILTSEGDDNVIFAAIDNGTYAGVIGIYREGKAKCRHKASIWGMFVSSDFRGKGVGKLLVEKAVAHARTKMKTAVVQLTVENSNESAKALYVKCGFKSWGVEPKAMRSGSKYFDDNHMILE